MPILLSLLIALAASAQPADLLVKNGRIWTGDAKRPWASSLLVTGGRIVAVNRPGPAKETLDLGGRFAMPGFNDAHIHFLGGSRGLSRVSLTGICTPSAIETAIREWARANPKTPWVTGSGWEYTCFPGKLPNKELLDRAVPDRPALISAYDGHSSWANSKALALAGVNRDTKFTGFGEVVKHPQTGEPTGALLEGAAGLVSRLVPRNTKDEDLAALRLGLKRAAELGITSIQNASGSTQELELWQEIQRTEPLTLRVSLAMSMGRRGGCAEFADLKGKHNSPWLRLASVKFMLDGVIESHTAAMLTEYSDGGNTKGELAWDEAAYKKAVADCAQQGWQIYTHAIGDRAVRVALDAYEAAPRGGRHRIEHIETIQPADIPRFGKLGVMASMEPIHADPGTIEVWSKAVGPARLPYSFPWRSLEQAGARLVFSSDWPAAISVDPIRGLHNAVNRLTLDGKPPGGWLPKQRVPLATALHAYTTAGAYSSFEEGNKGVLKEGFYADLVALSADPFKIAPLEIGTTRVDITVVDGRVIFRR